MSSPNPRLVGALIDSIIAQAEVLKATGNADYQKVVKLRQTVMELENEVEQR